MNAHISVYGKYILLDRIAVGGMAEVFKAKTFGIHGFERILVIKRILPHLTQDKEFVEMFIDEAKIAVELTHANICQVSDLGKIADNYFIAMEYINGKDLRAILKKCYSSKKSISVPHATYITLEILKGLDYAHNRIDSMSGKLLNLIHRDISPQNIMLSYHGEIKIVDFGIAKTESKLHRTQAGVLKGKFGYMSPEQASGLELDQRTDIFSTGILFYEMLTGRRLFHADSDFKTLEAIKECVVPSPKKYNAAISDELEEILFKSLSKERNHRYKNAQDMQSALSKVFYTNYADFNPKELSDFLADLFKTEIIEENEALKRALDQLSKDDIRSASSAANFDIQGGYPHVPTAEPKSNTASVILSAPEEEKSFLNSLWVKLFILLSTSFLLVLTYWFLFHKPATSVPKATDTTQQITLNTLPPGATISIEGEVRGESPLNVLMAKDKTYQIKVDLPGYETLEDQLTIKPEQKVYDFKLSKPELKFGSVFVDSIPPGARIIVNGSSTDMVTPSTAYKLKLNQTHEITVEKEGYKTVTKNVDLKQSTQEILLEMEKIGAQVKINVIPETAQILLDGKSVTKVIDGLTQNKTYELTLKEEGYETEVRKIEILENFIELDIELKKKEAAKGVINISAIPWATVTIDGKKIGSTPLLNLQLPVGNHEIIFQHQDFKDVKKTVSIKKGDNPPMILDLRQENQ